MFKRDPLKKLIVKVEGGNRDAVFYTLRKDGDNWIAALVPDKPAESTKANESFMDIFGLGITAQVTWLTGKPAPKTEDRNQGLIAIMKDFAQYLPDEDRAKIRMDQFGIGHPGGVRITWNEPRD